MKKMMLLSATAMLCMGLSAANAADPAPAPDPTPTPPPPSADKDQGSGKIDFIGAVIDAPCSVDANDGKPVDLGSTSIKSLTNKKKNPKNFNINLKDCDIGDKDKSKTVYITFTGSGAYQPGGDSKDILGVTGSAKNVGIILQNGTGQQITLGKTFAVREVKNGNQDLPFAAYVTQVGDADPVAGKFFSTANFTLTYL